MFDEIPVRVWLLLLIGLCALPSAQYVIRHFRSSPPNRDITQPQGDLSWRTSKALLWRVLILFALGATAAFIFTPYAERTAKEPRFVPILMASLAGWALFSVARGIVNGKIQPFTKGVSDEYDRQSQPKRFWASLIWNAILGSMMLWGSFLLGAVATTQSAEDRCFSDDMTSSLNVRNEACSDLIAVYDAAIRDDPSDYYAQYNRALAYELLGNSRNAIAGYSNSIGLRPTDGDAYLNRGVIYLNAMDYDLALADFDRAHRLDPHSADPLANRGMAQAWKGFTDEATSDFSLARSIDPNNVVVMRGEVLLAMNLADFNLAIKRATEALARHPNDPWTLTMRADAYRRLGEHRKADADTSRVNMLVRQATSS